MTSRKFDKCHLFSYCYGMQNENKKEPQYASEDVATIISCLSKAQLRFGNIRLSQIFEKVDLKPSVISEILIDLKDRDLISFGTPKTLSIGFIRASIPLMIDYDSDYTDRVARQLSARVQDFTTIIASTLYDDSIARQRTITRIKEDGLLEKAVVFRIKPNIEELAFSQN